MSRITFEDVSTAARRLVESGERPSAPKIRKLLGDRGGMATIQKHLDSWREADGKDAEASQIPEMPEQLAADAQTLIQQIWGQARAAANEEIQADREKLSQERAQMQEKLDETIAVSEQQEQQIDDLKDQVKTLERKVDELDQASQSAKAELAESGTQAAVLAERCRQYEANLKLAQEREEKLLAQLEKLSESIKTNAPGKKA